MGIDQTPRKPREDQAQQRYSKLPGTLTMRGEYRFQKNGVREINSEGSIPFGVLKDEFECPITQP
jgi:hypothetical protein